MYHTDTLYRKITSLLVLLPVPALNVGASGVYMMAMRECPLFLTMLSLTLNHSGRHTSQWLQWSLIPHTSRSLSGLQSSSSSQVIANTVMQTFVRLDNDMMYVIASFLFSLLLYPSS